MRERDPGRAEAPIRRRRSFFETAWSRVVTLLAYGLLVGLGLAYLARPDLFGPGHQVRLLLVILPGVAYLTYRVYLKPDRGAD